MGGGYLYSNHGNTMSLDVDAATTLQSSEKLKYSMMNSLGFEDEDEEAYNADKYEGGANVNFDALLKPTYLINYLY